MMILEIKLLFIQKYHPFRSRNQQTHSSTAAQVWTSWVGSKCASTMFNPKPVCEWWRWTSSLLVQSWIRRISSRIHLYSWKHKWSVCGELWSWLSFTDLRVQPPKEKVQFIIKCWNSLLCTGHVWRGFIGKWP